jgi:hypothetical protein
MAESTLGMSDNLTRHRALLIFDDAGELQDFIPVVKNDMEENFVRSAFSRLCSGQECEVNCE